MTRNQKPETRFGTTKIRTLNRTGKSNYLKYRFIRIGNIIGITGTNEKSIKNSSFNTPPPYCATPLPNKYVV